MGLIRKVATIMMRGGVSSHTGREPPGRAEWVRAKAGRARKKAAQAQAMRAEAEAEAERADPGAERSEVQRPVLVGSAEDHGGPGGDPAQGANLV